MTTMTDSMGSIGPMHVRAPASLELRDIHKNYGRLKAVDGVSVVARPAEVLGIAGPNGAGKTTLFDVISGHSSPASGSILLENRELTKLSVHRRCRMGLARTFQKPTVTESLTVHENVAVAVHFGRAQEHWVGFNHNNEELSAWAVEWAGLTDQADHYAAVLGVFDRKRLMLSTAMALGPRVLLLDEPFGGLNSEEVERTLDLIRKAARFGVTVICIEHVMRALARLADSVLVMHRGSVMFAGSPSAMMSDPQTIELYLGKKQV